MGGHVTLAEPMSILPWNPGIDIYAGGKTTLLLAGNIKEAGRCRCWEVPFFPSWREDLSVGEDNEMKL